MFNCSFLLILSWHSHICLYNPEDFISSAHCFLPLVTTLNLSYLTFISWSLLQSIQWLFPRSNPNQVELWKLGYSLIPHVSGSEFGTGLLPSPDQGHTASVKHSVQFSSVAQLCLTLCSHKDCSNPGLPVQHQLQVFTQTHVHWVSDAIEPSHPVVPSSFCLHSFPALMSFQMSQFFLSGGQSIGVSASASLLPMNFQD